jgi:hypothetical protein
MKPWNEMSDIEKDILIAEEVFKKKDRICIPNYSTSICGAWEIVTHLSEEYGFFLIAPHRSLVLEHEYSWSCVLTYRATGVCYLAYAASAPEVICLAALKAVSKEFE